MQGVLISLGISQLQNAMLKQEKEQNGTVLYLLSNEKEQGVLSSVLTIWVQSPNDLRIIERATLHELIARVDQKSLSQLIPSSLMFLLPKFDFPLIQEFLDKITFFISELETVHNGVITIQLQNVKINNRRGQKKELKIKVVLHRPGEEDHVIESEILQNFIEAQIRKAEYPNGQIG